MSACLAWAIIAAAVVPATAGQSGVAVAAQGDAARPEGALVVEDVMHAKSALVMGEGGFGARLHLASAALAVRNRTLAGADVGHPVSQVQTANALRGELRVDHTGRFAIHGGAATGGGFNGGWTTTGIGAGTPEYPFFLKQLYASATFRKGLAIETGGLYILRGESTEATSYDNDGYIVGERVVLTHPFRHALEQLAVTRAYLGDLDRPAVLDRLHRLDRANYYQLQATKRVAAASASVDVTSHSGAQVFRAAAAIPMPRSRVFDLVRVEQYSRLRPNRSVGFAATVRRRLSHQLMAAGGMSNVDRRYGSLNGDLYGTGIRMFASARLTISGGWMASVQAAKRLNDATPVTSRVRLDVAIAYDVLHALDHARRRSGPHGAAG